MAKNNLYQFACNNFSAIKEFRKLQIQILLQKKLYFRPLYDINGIEIDRQHLLEQLNLTDDTKLAIILTEKVGKEFAERILKYMIPPSP